MNNLTVSFLQLHCRDQSTVYSPPRIYCINTVAPNSHVPIKYILGVSCNEAILYACTIKIKQISTV